MCGVCMLRVNFPCAGCTTGRMAALEDAAPAPEQLDEEAEEGGGGEAESLEEMKARHKKEVRELEEACRMRLKRAKEQGGKKGGKKKQEEARAQNAQQEDDLQYRHRQEIEEFEERDPDQFAAAELAAVVAEEEAAAAAAAAEAVPKKKGKAQRKREKKAELQRERERQIEVEKANMVSPRKVELEAINHQLAHLPDALVTHEVLSDGHCLFRAVDHQLRCRGLPLPDVPNSTGFMALRHATASFMRSHSDDFMPFLALSVEGGVGDAAEGDMNTAFSDYCDRMANTADWGGQGELLALTRVLQMPIRVFSAEGPPLVMGEEFVADATPTLELTFHRHFYALGEHYNSTLPLALADQDA